MVEYTTFIDISGYSCFRIPSALGSPTVTYYCADSCDCPDGQVCCDVISNGAAQRLGGRCLDADSCLTALPYFIRLCRTDADCPDELTCAEGGVFTSCHSP